MIFARLLRSLTRFRRIQPQVGRLHAALLQRSRGRIRRSRLLARGQPVLALTTTGRRSGAQRTTTVAYLPHGQGYAVSAANLGSDHHPGWCLNLRADPSAVVHVDGQRIPVRARQAQGEEAEALWRKIIERLPASGHFRQLARREIPVFVLEPA
jgi:deazaflavin-dependent oxidoreductase (nitroreductase family)